MLIENKKREISFFFLLQLKAIINLKLICYGQENIVRTETGAIRQSR